MPSADSPPGISSTRFGQYHKEITQAIEELGRGSIATITGWFTAMDLPSPRVVQAIEDRASRITPDRNQRLLDYWHNKAKGADVPHYRQIDPVDIRDLLGYLAIVDVVAGGADFRYRLYGSDIVRHTGNEMTGRLTSDLVERAQVQPFIPMFFAVINTRVRLDRTPWYSEHQPPPHISQMIWQRLALPLLNDNGEVFRLLLSMVPGESTGLDMQGLRNTG